MQTLAPGCRCRSSHEPLEDENNNFGELPASQTVSPAREPKNRLDYYFRDSGMHTFLKKGTAARVWRPFTRALLCRKHRNNSDAVVLSLRTPCAV
jgi:hypothetical protein